MSFLEHNWSNAIGTSNSNRALSTLLGEKMSPGLIHNCGSAVTGSPLLQSTKGAVGCLCMLKCVSVMTFKVSSGVCVKLPSRFLTEFSRVALFSLITIDIRLKVDLLSNLVQSSQKFFFGSGHKSVVLRLMRAKFWPALVCFGGPRLSEAKPDTGSASRTCLVSHGGALILLET